MGNDVHNIWILVLLVVACFMLPTNPYSVFFENDNEKSNNHDDK
jgi:hypothetical protein